MSGALADADAPGAEPAAFRRVLVKLSGESLMGDEAYGIDPERVAAVAKQLGRLTELEIETAVVIGAGNIYRGMTAAAAGMERATADYAGMLATLLN
jgi:uridylate kinase